MNSRVALIYIDSGGGHRAAAEALCDVIREERRPWDVQAVSIQTLLDSIDFIRKSTGVPFQEVYNIMLRRGWTRGTQHTIPLMHLLIRLFHQAQVEVLERFWREARPDLVVSLIPHYNRALGESLRKVCPKAAFVTILTDLADYPPHFWIERMDQHVICGSGRAIEQAREIGIPADRILRASGMILHPRFYRRCVANRSAERLRLGLHPDRPTGLALFGGQGSAELFTVARALNHPDCGVQLILLCGKNEAVASELRRLEPHIPMHVEGFTREAPYYMELADFFIGKPGPGCISEALAKGLPLIVQNNAWTMAHERYNAQWVEDQGVGISVTDFAREIPAAVRRLLHPIQYQRFRDRAVAMSNRAVFEIPRMLDGILSERGQAETVMSGEV